MSLWSDIKAFRSFLRSWHATADAMEDEAAEQSEVKPDDVIVTYFVPYTFTYSKYYNGGKTNNGWGNTLIHVRGGMDNWAKIRGSMYYIKNNIRDQFPNPQVIISGFFEVERCIANESKEVPEQVAASPSEP